MAVERDPQNIYDDPAFFAGYSQLERFGAGWTTALEHPCFMDILPDVTGKRVLDLGCGAGQLAYYLAERRRSYQGFELTFSSAEASTWCGC